MTASLLPESEIDYDFLEPVRPQDLEDDDPLFAELIITRAFKRLREISFLGGIDYLITPASNIRKGAVRYTRYQHSLGVARLALLYSGIRSLPKKRRRVVLAAALLHDIGHPPFSHSLEPVFKEHFELEHHRATEDIICGRIPLGVQVYETLHRHRVDIDNVNALIAGEDQDYEGFFGGPINFDTIEGITRSKTYINHDARILSPEIIVMSAIHRNTAMDGNIVDEFWRYKDDVYRNLINSKIGILADMVCQGFLRHHLTKIAREDYFLAERDFFRKLPGLKKVLANITSDPEISRILDQPITYTVRRFSVNLRTDFRLCKYKDRYIQRKTFGYLSAQSHPGVKPQQLHRDLFDDDRV
jgi:hypothetical protein